MSVGLLSVTEPGERAPLVAAVWCGPGVGEVVRFSTGDDRSLEAVRRAGRATLILPDPGGGYVSVEGTLLVTEPADPEDLRRWAGERYDRFTEDDLERMTTVRLRL
jgi:hypothetical protein